LNTLLQLQELDLQIEKLKDRELEIPKQKGKFDIHKKRLAEELARSEERVKQLQVEQRQCEGDIEQKHEQIKKYDGQLLNVKKNDEYQALLHEMDNLKKQIGQREERILNLMEDLDSSKAQLEEDRKRIQAERKRIEEQEGEIDQELAVAVSERKTLEGKRDPLQKDIDPSLLSRYKRIRKAKQRGPAIVALNDESCGGCHMKVTPQIVNEVMGGNIHACAHCGRLLYFPENFSDRVSTI
jgi:predicted  nucleic acid-binding Zn-ribbon protein